MLQNKAKAKKRVQQGPVKIYAGQHFFHVCWRLPLWYDTYWMDHPSARRQASFYLNADRAATQTLMVLILISCKSILNFWVILLVSDTPFPTLQMTKAVCNKGPYTMFSNWHTIHWQYFMASFSKSHTN